MSKLKLLGALLLTVGGTTQLLYAEQPSVMANPNIVQQKSTCSGVVKDAAGESVIGASVLVKGTTIGTITDFDGNFELPNVEKGAVIQVSFVGYLTKEVVWKGTPISVVLEDDTKTLEEVVVVGYGTQKKVNLTGSVAMAESDVLENRPIANLAQGLQGVIPNLNISFANGNPNAETSINVRGLTSLNGGSALVLVDGVETNDISLINPQDIESISVLKDASSAAVYGARAAFGVVLITTKKGKTGEKITFNYNNNFSWSTPSRLPHSLPADQWLRAMNTESKNTSGTQYWSDELIAAVDAYMQDPTRPTAWENTQGNKFTANGEWAYAGNTDWMDIFYKNAAFMQQHNASLRGGSEKTAYYASLGYKGQDGLLAFGTDTYKRINMSFNFTSKVTNWLEIGFRTKYNRSEINEPNSNHYTSEDPYYEVYRAFPFIPVYLPDGDFAAVAGSNFNFNIAGMLAQAGRKKNIYDDIWYTGSFNLTPLKGLSIKGDYTGNRLFRDERAHNKTIYQKQPDGSQIAKGEPNGVSLKKYDDTYQALNLWAEYKFELPKSHSFTAMVGYNQESKKTSNFYGYVTDLYLNDAPIIDWANTKQKLEEAAREEKMKQEVIDVTLPAKKAKIGHRHPNTIALEEVERIFIGMGYEVVEGPEVEYADYNFTKLNIPENHPARDEQDTFFINDSILLRSQTSPVQARTMEKGKLPIRMIAPGRVFRSDEVDATHSPSFHQIEGLVIDKNITFADLKGTLQEFAQELFGPETKTKFRPHHFPFTEPSAEVDVSCFKCGGKGCRFCKGSGWIEILGCGMVHPNVLSMCGIDPEEYTGFAFGVGLERIALLKYEIDDMRLLYENDIRFLKQF